MENPIHDTMLATAKTLMADLQSKLTNRYYTIHDKQKAINDTKVILLSLKAMYADIFEISPMEADQVFPSLVQLNAA